jgi:type II secretory pathway predicted ATPase ExeA
MTDARQSSSKLILCSHLGLASDETLCHAYPSLENHCYAEGLGRRASRSIPIDVQGELCLTEQFTQCPTYLRATLGQAGRLPLFGIRNYFDFFGLREEPFSIVPMPRYLYYTPNQLAVLQGLQHLVEARQGLGILYGPIGTGKTVLCRTFCDRLSADSRYTVVFLATPGYRSEFAMLQGILHRLQVPTRARSQRDLERRLLGYLVREVIENERTVVLVIDEAQTLRARLLELVRKLLNYQTSDTQLLQVVMSGQMELVKRMRRWAPALRDRAVVEYTLEPMTPDDVAAMIQDRLARAGREEALFTTAATRLVYERSRGYPRRAIVICIRSMWLAYQERVRRIDAPLVQRAVDGILADAPDEILPEGGGGLFPGVEGVVSAGRSLGDWIRRLPLLNRILD